MDNTLAKLLEYFKHIVRDLFVYVFSGLVVIANLTFIDYQFYNKQLGFLKILNELDYKILVILVVAYIIGHIIMAVMFLFFEVTGIDKKITDIYKINIDQEKEIKVYKENLNLYEYFIERQNQLYYVRWNVAGAFLISLVIDIFLEILYKNLDVKISYYIFLFITFFILLILHYKTAIEYSNTIENCLKGKLKCKHS